MQTKLHQLRSTNPNLQNTSAAGATISLASTGDELSESATEGLNVGLLAYPVLQAADILIYRATGVPIGEDQIQHMNLTSDVARSFNSYYNKEVFPIPKSIFASSEAKRIMSLRHPTNKMSKSDPSDATRINLSDTPDQIRSKIRKATTDTTLGISYDPDMRPGVANLLRIHSAFSGEE
ncbi:hypothetical protein HK097_003182, partial [Rhizophlyctis rosea]